VLVKTGQFKVPKRSRDLPPTTLSKGNAIDRELYRHIQDNSRRESSLSPMAKAAISRELQMKKLKEKLQAVVKSRVKSRKRRKKQRKKMKHRL